jgi:uncharacterized membrane protein
MTTPSTPPTTPRKSNFRRFFLRGLGIVLPTLLTLYILVAVYGFVDQRIAAPINSGIKRMWVAVLPWPRAQGEDYIGAEQSLNPLERSRWEAAGSEKTALEPQARAVALERRWGAVSIGGWALLNVLGLLVAIALVYIVGVMFGNLLGVQLYKRGEQMLKRVPVFKAIYPHVKQVTDFLVGGGDDQKMRFTRVIAVQYPRKGMWSLGLVTGQPLRSLQEAARPDELVTVFIPASPPISGYVITAPVSDTLEMPMSIEDALRYIVTGGVIVPESQAALIPVIDAAGGPVSLGPSPVVRGDPAGRN